jgi:RNA polymerase sigma factor (sigma-70 family)
MHMRLNAAQQEQVRAHLGLARAYAARAARGCRRSAGEDLFAAAALGLCLAAADFNPTLGVPFAAYAVLRIKGELGTAVRRQLPLGFRYSSRRSSSPSFVPLTDAHDPVAPSPRPADDVEWTDLIAWWFARLTPDQALVVLGIYWNGLPIRASKQWSGIPYSYARKLHSEALARLRSELAA